MARTEYKVRGLHAPILKEKLDPSQSFSAQLRKATRAIDQEDPNNFRNVTDSLIKAKKDKLNTVREA